MSSIAVAHALLEIGAVGFNFEQPITFKSGILSPVYVDNRRLPFHTAQWQVVIQAFQNLIQTHALDHDVIAGVAVGGIPHSATLGYTLNKPSVFIRKEAKEHGKQQLVEGGDVTHQRVLLIEDMVTTGGSSLKAVQALRTEGAIVNDLLTIVSYNFAEATKNFAEAHIRLYNLTNFSVILAVALETQRLQPHEATVIRDWLDDPYGWASRKGLA
jgi:orotate phosphoribosyltransferase